MIAPLIGALLSVEEYYRKRREISETYDVSTRTLQRYVDPFSVFICHIALSSPSLIILHNLLCTLRSTRIREVTYRLAEFPGGVDDAVI